MEREGDPREPVMVDPRMQRLEEEQGGRPVPRPSDARDWQGTGLRDARGPLREKRALRPGEDQAHQQDRMVQGEEQHGEEDAWEKAVKRSGILGGRGRDPAGAAGSEDAARSWTWAGRGLDLDWAWNDEHKVWIPERAQRPNDEEELIGETDLFADMERNYG